MISKQWSGFAREFFTDAENFGISCKDIAKIFIKFAFAIATT